MNVSLVGATGYGGVELIRLLHQHPVFKLNAIYSHSKGGESIQSYFPHLLGLCELIMDDIDPAAVKAKSDLVFLAVPAGISRDWSKKLREAGLKVVDLSGDFRLEDPDEYETWYKKDAIAPEELEGVVFGLADVAAEAIKTAEFISNPGCYPTASLLGLYPLAINGLILPGSIIIDAKSGVSGAGRGASVGSLFCEVADNLKIYKVSQHQHTPEIEQQLNKWDPAIGLITFETHLIPMNRGIMVTEYVELVSPMTARELHDLYSETYQNAPFVRVRPLGEFPSTKEVQGSNYCDIGVTVNPRTGKALIVAVLDNLVKGAAGQAVQNANIWTGQDPATGLELVPMYP
ncbi:N-acetyl-gamma-glutamyl-phosphate reductase [Clostridiaceae bacterium HFYG-1003]|nr:N-acetyl-gamma-glutamyl-phosphate reductase [Clostridiaceae bacterium HFYG-1003]